MIVVDSSALLAVVLNEPAGPPCRDALALHRELAISGGTLAESLVVADRKGVADLLDALIARLRPEIVPLDEGFARRVCGAYGRWGKGVHPAKLNLFDCFAYVLARDLDCPLLFVGKDFPRTDVRGVLDPPLPPP
ncbi:MAG: type II toxin-antitoxin system VapC family toxin [Sphingomonadaceae bacterium]|nr:type II toxin-antitoxin system VapC family toxin [Sphingomonadaceae bacterium]